MVDSDPPDDDGDDLPPSEKPKYWFLLLQPGPTNLKAFSLRPASHLFTKHLFHFLGTAKALESFDYEVVHAETWFPISSAAINQALDQQKATLKSVRLALCEQAYANEDWMFSPMSFKDYTSLTYLSVAYNLLLRDSEQDNMPHELGVAAAQDNLVRALPGSLETLELVQCDTKVIEAATSTVRTVFNVKEEKCPRLNMVVFTVEEDGWDDLKETRKQLQAEGKLHGVTYKAGIESSFAGWYDYEEDEDEYPSSDDEILLNDEEAGRGEEFAESDEFEAEENDGEGDDDEEDDGEEE